MATGAVVSGLGSLAHASGGERGLGASEARAVLVHAPANAVVPLLGRARAVSRRALATPGKETGLMVVGGRLPRALVVHEPAEQGGRPAIAVERPNASGERVGDRPDNPVGVGGAAGDVDGRF